MHGKGAPPKGKPHYTLPAVLVMICGTMPFGFFTGVSLFFSLFLTLFRYSTSRRQMSCQKKLKCLLQAEADMSENPVY